ncbi:MAG TPA: endopygalactorunase, partial [Chitinophagaceae bacterium]
MNKVLLLALVTPVTFVLSAPAQKRMTASPTEITYGKNATHIGRITADTLYVVSGSTYSFTVDTPEDKGLVSTNLTAKLLPLQLAAKDGSVPAYRVTGKGGRTKEDDYLVTGDRLTVTSPRSKVSKAYYIVARPMALSGRLSLHKSQHTLNTPGDLVLYFTAGQRSPDATVKIFLPPGINATLENTTVNVIGRGDVPLKDLTTQSIGRVGSRYSYSRVGEAVIGKTTSGGLVLTFAHLDLRPANGPDLKVVIRGVKPTKTGDYPFKATYTTSRPEILISAGVGTETAVLSVTSTVSDFERVIIKEMPYRETPDRYTSATFRWSTKGLPASTQLLQSTDGGRTWTPASDKIDIAKGRANITGLQAGQLYTFRLWVKEGTRKGYSNPAYFFSGKMDIKSFGVSGSGEDYTDKINAAIDYLHGIGGGTLLFSKGVYAVRTVHLKSNVYLFVDQGATIKALKGADAPEATWFSDKKYRSGLSPTDPGPYSDPENYLTKQDVGHHYFRNTMFFGERIDNVKIIGTGRITGDGNLVTGDKVMNNAPDNRADKMFTFKLCTNLEIGGLHRGEDLWYDPAKDEPYYILKNGDRDTTPDNMLHIDRAGHFVLLATGTDTIQVHNTYFGKYSTANARDIYDFMACNEVTVTNIYSKVSSDDIVKPGSDCALGFTRPARHYRVRNIIGDTNCNLFQIGSETADDIRDICVDNIYVLGANKAGFSISTNDGAHIKDIHLNCGHTGPLHARSKMFRTTTPFFISISNRARILGAEVGQYAFHEHGRKRRELLVKNVNIGQVENILINGVDCYEV